MRPEPCQLPALPQPVVLGGAPDHCTRRDGSLCPGPESDCACDKYTLTKDGLVALVQYLVDLRAWVSAANRCLMPWQTAAMPGRVVRVSHVQAPLMSVDGAAP